MIVLICTFGYDENKVIQAMRWIKHDRVVIFTGLDNTEKESYDHLVDYCRMVKTPLETCLVDKFDLIESMNAIQDKINVLKREGCVVKVNVSGGVPLLCDAALLASFNTGVQSFYADEQVVSLPVLRDVTITERLTEQQRSIILRIGEGIHLEELAPPEKGKKNSVKEQLIRLKEMKLINVQFVEGAGYVTLTDEGKRIMQWLAREDQG